MRSFAFYAKGKWSRNTDWSLIDPALKMHLGLHALFNSMEDRMFQCQRAWDSTLPQQVLEPAVSWAGWNIFLPNLRKREDRTGGDENQRGETAARSAATDNTTNDSNESGHADFYEASGPMPQKAPSTITMAPSIWTKSIAPDRGWRQTPSPESTNKRQSANGWAMIERSSSHAANRRRLTARKVTSRIPARLCVTSDSLTPTDFRLIVELC